MLYIPVNNVVGLQLASPRSVGGSSLVLRTGQGARVAALPTRITVVTAGTYGSAAESLTIFGVTAVSGDALTITGPLEGTVDRNYVVGDYADLRVTAGYINDLNVAMNGISTVGGDLSGTLPNPTVISTNGVPFGTMATQNANAVGITGGNITATLAGNGVGIIGLNASNLASGTVPTPQLPIRGLTIAQHAGPINVPPGTSGVITMDLSLSDWQAPAACTGAFTLALSNLTVGQQFTVILTQAASGGPFAVTWFSGTIFWMGAPYTAPTMPTTASAKLSATFKCISAGVYLGWWLGNSAA